MSERASTPTLVSERREVRVQGIVQGVGFRPFVYTLAGQYGLSGVVRNDAEGVYIEAEGESEALEQFVQEISTGAPPLAVVEMVSSRRLAVRGGHGFHIEESRDGSQRRTLVSPDVATCEACLRELFDPADRRYRYPFINCTHCGPRFTITRSVPYDRAVTTMSGFPLCPDCRAEYDDPTNRRFHAQPNACPVCGPQVRLLRMAGGVVDDESAGDGAMRGAVALLRAGSIVALKGLGGYHLACNPFDPAAVRALRERKVRQDKPFALMARDLAQVRSLCRANAAEEALLTSAARPIVLLPRRQVAGLAGEVAPRQRTLGVMLAYTPLHHLLLHDVGVPLVMTSGNRCDEPIAFRDEEALEQLGQITNWFLVHDRPIHVRCDDSVVRVERQQRYPLRRSRGYAPAPLALSRRFARHILACGGELKNTFCLGREQHAFLSHHIGDLENYETLRSFREEITHYCRLFGVCPELVAHDLHPGYLSTQYALEMEEAGMETVGVQHHHAHIAACLADNQRPIDERVVGVALDGTGYGTDGTIWGGEFLEGSVAEGFARHGHLAYAPLPGGEAAIREPWRAAIAHLLEVFGEEETLQLPLDVVRQAGERNVRLISQLVQQRLNTPLTSSAGRLFDAVAALVGVPGSVRTSYEGQAAIELEMVAQGQTASSYPFSLTENGDMWIIETSEVIAGVVADLIAAVPPSRIAARFHRTIAEMVLTGCRRLRAGGGSAAVALSGGSFQNSLLLNQAVDLLVEDGFTVYVHQRVPANDGGLALGQAVLADSIIRARHGEKGQARCV